ncbi:beta-1,2-xylosyltransferase XYXT1-like [Phragmites australis]|uniref:beta-1,2-xylosyltransferase XYXT1-like n=1 Tax=Phragmites australis TaxID=29695 RepID=UPI002D78FBF0|nr:beta-1,2-xylosyltransferase XYXT1-like [Phragmites australis]
MCCCEVKPGKSWVQSHLNVGFLVGVLLVLVTCLVVSQQVAISGPNVVITEALLITDKQLIKAPGETEKVVCDTEDRFSDSCEIDGDVRTNGTALSVVIVPTTWSERREWRIRPFSCKTMSSIKKVTVTQLQDRAAAPPCTVTHSIPAVLFSLGGTTGNYWHDFSDVLVPLFIASRRYDGEVQLLISNIQPWWVGIYKALLQRLSRYDVVDLDSDAQVRCFRHITVGLRMHKVFSIVPERVPGGRLSMADFTRFQRETYALPRDAPVSLTQEPDKKPRLLLIQRGHSRRFVNEQEIARAAEAAGLEAVAMELRREAMTVDEQARVVNSFDVLLGVHGAGLTNAVFLPPGAVLIQVAPYGMEFIARVEFGEPATDMGLRYHDYNVTAEESTLLEMLGPDHPVIRDPDSVHRSRWDKVAEFYLRQDVRIDVARFAPTLAQALDHLRLQQGQGTHLPGVI